MSSSCIARWPYAAAAAAARGAAAACRRRAALQRRGAQPRRAVQRVRARGRTVRVVAHAVAVDAAAGLAAQRGVRAIAVGVGVRHGEERARYSRGGAKVPALGCRRPARRCALARARFCTHGRAARRGAGVTGLGRARWRCELVARRPGRAFRRRSYRRTGGTLTKGELTRVTSSPAALFGPRGWWPEHPPALLGSDTTRGGSVLRPPHACDGGRAHVSMLAQALGAPSSACAARSASGGSEAAAGSHTGASPAHPCASTQPAREAHDGVGVSAQRSRQPARGGQLGSSMPAGDSRCAGASGPASSAACRFASSDEALLVGLRDQPYGVASLVSGHQRAVGHDRKVAEIGVAVECHKG